MHLYAKNHHSLGNSGLKISKIILGTMSYGSKQWQDWVLDEEESLPLIEHAYKRGINTWDTVSKPTTLLRGFVGDNANRMPGRRMSTPTADQRK